MLQIVMNDSPQCLDKLQGFVEDRIFEPVVGLQPQNITTVVNVLNCVSKNLPMDLELFS